AWTSRSAPVGTLGSPRRGLLIALRAARGTVYGRRSLQAPCAPGTLFIHEQSAPDRVPSRSWSSAEENPREGRALGVGEPIHEDSSDRPLVCDRLLGGPGGGPGRVQCRAGERPQDRAR